MFRRGKHEPQKRIDSLIGAGTVLRGDVVFAGGLRIDGKVFGNVTAAGGDDTTLVIIDQARIEGAIKVSHAVINGVVDGPVVATEYLELQAKARVAGDVRYRTLEMHVGAVVQGRLEHAEPGRADVVEFKRALVDGRSTAS